MRSTLLDAYIFQTCRRDLSNLSVQESRLRRQREKDLAELKQLQEERIAKREARLNAAAHMYERFKENDDPFDPVEFGFEFSFDEIEERCGLFEGPRIRCQYPDERTGRWGPVVRDQTKFAKIHAADLRAERLAA